MTGLQKMVELIKDCKKQLFAGLMDSSISGEDRHTLQGILALFDGLIIRGEELISKEESK